MSVNMPNYTAVMLFEPGASYRAHNASPRTCAKKYPAGIACGIQNIYIAVSTSGNLQDFSEN
jgi:hypothetical protein